MKPELAVKNPTPDDSPETGYALAYGVRLRFHLRASFFTST